jgi:hypothetical protein
MRLWFLLTILTSTFRSYHPQRRLNFLGITLYPLSRPLSVQGMPSPQTAPFTPSLLFITLHCPYPIQDCISCNTRFTNYYHFTVYKVFRIYNRFKFSFAFIINNIIHQLYVKLSELVVISGDKDTNKP